MNNEIIHDPTKKYSRIQASLKGGVGPTVVVLSGLHGNEPAGVLAVEKFVDNLKKVNGEFISIIGHIKALSLDKRFIKKDLNRIWDEETISRVRKTDANNIICPEEREQKEILRVLDDILKDTSKSYIFFDIHTTSAEGPAFTFIEDEEKSKKLVFDLHVPNLLGLEAKVNGTFINYINSLGHKIIAYEAGQNKPLSSVDNALAFLWIMAKNVGLINDSQIDINHWQKVLKKSCHGLPQYLRIVYRHRITSDDNFVMQKGYKTFQKIKEGEILAKDAKGAVKAPISGRILFPLYQGQGNDGFFIVKEEA